MSRSFLGIIILVVAAILAVLVGRYFVGRGGGLSGRLRPRHVVTRIICGSLGLALMVVVGAICYWSFFIVLNVGGIDTAQTVKVPNMPPPPLPVQPGDADKISLDNARLLVDVIALDVQGDKVRPLLARQFFVDWPSDKQSWKKEVIDIGDLKIYLRFKVNELANQFTEPNAKGRLSYDYQTKLMWNYRHIYGGDADNGNSSFGDNCFMFFNLASLPVHSFDSGWIPVRFSSDKINSHLIIHIQRIDSNDQMREVPLIEMVAANQDEIGRQIKTQLNVIGTNRHLSNEKHFFGLMEYMGLPLLLLVLSAILLAQVFRHRQVALVGTFVAIMLYAVVLDYAITRFSLHKMNDSSAGYYVRQAAANVANDSYFFGKSAGREVSDWRRKQDAFDDESGECVIIPGLKGKNSGVSASSPDNSNF